MLDHSHTTAHAAAQGIDFVPKYIAGFRFSEWYATGEVYEDTRVDLVCELCGKTQLRWHFEIGRSCLTPKRSPLKATSLWVGSHCIEKFDLPYDDGTTTVAGREAVQRELNRRVRDYLRDLNIRAIEELQRLNPHELNAAVLARLRDNEPPTVKMAGSVMYWLRRFRIRFHGFKVRLRRDQDYVDVAKMFDTLIPRMSRDQQRRAMKARNGGAWNG